MADTKNDTQCLSAGNHEHGYEQIKMRNPRQHLPTAVKDLTNCWWIVLELTPKFPDATLLQPPKPHTKKSIPLSTFVSVPVAPASCLIAALNTFKKKQTASNG